MGDEAIWLVGMMGAGKSAVGAVLAGRLGRTLLDTDLELERRAGLTVREIFERYGEAEFRRRERALLLELLGSPQVVALGGGGLSEPGLARELAGKVTLVYLRARPETLAARLGEALDRPLLRGLPAAERLERIRALLERRAADYEKAAVVVDTDELGVEQVAEAVLCALAQRR